MWDWLRRSRMGMAEGRFIAINANTRRNGVCAVTITPHSPISLPVTTTWHLVQTQKQMNVLRFLAVAPPCTALICPNYQPAMGRSTAGSNSQVICSLIACWVIV